MPKNLESKKSLRFVDAVAQGKVNHENASEFVKGLLGMSGDPAEVYENEMEKGKPDEYETR